jgi:hypothetical protein
MMRRREFIAGVAGAAALGLPRVGSGAEAVPTLSLLPFLARPTTDSIFVTARNGDTDASVRLEVSGPGDDEMRAAGDDRQLPPGAFMDWTVDGLDGGTTYDYRLISGVPGRQPLTVARGSFTTQRVGEESFTAALMTDSHTGTFPEGGPPVEVLDDVVRNVRREQPEFVLALGDNVAWNTSRNRPQTDDVGARRAYTMYRRHMAPLTMSCPHFGLIGNWEGETGKLPGESTDMVADVRKRFAPNPDDTTYPQGGSPDEDYYAFEWGPALFVILNVQSYTEPSGEMINAAADVTLVEDWTLGGEQFAWMERTLERSDHPFKFVCIHHSVGGNAGDESNTLYGRGGARAADVGEQRLLHEAMREFGVQAFFYGHDHVFVDDVVDEIHYALPGSCGAPWKFGAEATGYGRYWGDSGHGRLQVRPDRARVSFVNQAGQVIHEFAMLPR